MARARKIKSLPAAASREADRRREILRAAIEVFARKGYHGCRIADVAREAGVAYGLVYHYYADKEALLQTVFEVGWGGFVKRLKEVAARSGTLEEKVTAFAEVAFEAYRVDPRGVKVLILEIGRSPATGKVERASAFIEVMQLTASMFAQGKSRGELRLDLDPQLLAAMLFGAIEMGLTAFVLGLFVSKDEAALERAKTQVAQTFLRGVLPAVRESEPSSRRPKPRTQKA